MRHSTDTVCTATVTSVLCQVALLDIDICGPSIPRIMGLEGEQVSRPPKHADSLFVATDDVEPPQPHVVHVRDLSSYLLLQVHQSGSGWSPVVSRF